MLLESLVGMRFLEGMMPVQFQAVFSSGAAPPASVHGARHRSPRLVVLRPCSLKADNALNMLITDVDDIQLLIGFSAHPFVFWVHLEDGTSGPFLVLETHTMHVHRNPDTIALERLKLAYCELSPIAALVNPVADISPVSAASAFNPSSFTVAISLEDHAAL
ncbi:hypothetical protein HPB50_017119 [Hyalomma asiaticum]|uniref:Uncharacterized protein n=1 Tax=Hyalomma asiaticum TaxID=266040 RepID=A0ACB7S0T6_HYAAI|nr:hypothetical protein HPB50_017119 [Hyalomma asiaticum]